MNYSISKGGLLSGVVFLGAGTGRTIAAGCTYLSILVRSRVCRMDRVVKCYFVTSNQNLVAGEFVGAHGLVTNDFILIYQNVEDGKYVREPTNPLLCFPFICFPNSYTSPQIIEARKKGQDVSPRVPNKAATTEPAPAPALELLLPDLPALDDVEMVYAYDTNFLDDSPLDYVGESINLPNIGSDSSFDDYNPEDFDFEIE